MRRRDPYRWRWLPIPLLIGLWGALSLWYGFSILFTGFAPFRMSGHTRVATGAEVAIILGCIWVGYFFFAAHREMKRRRKWKA